MTAPPREPGPANGLGAAPVELPFAEEAAPGTLPPLDPGPPRPVPPRPRPRPRFGAL